MRREQTKEHLDFLELAYLEVDGELTARQARSLDDHVLECAECRAVRDETPALRSALAREAIEAHPDLARRVMDNLPPAAWEMRRPASWKAAAVAVFLLLGGAYVLNLGGESANEALPWIASLTAMVELFRSAALAGAGLLAASWSSVGLAVGETLSRSPAGFVGFGIFVLGVDLLFVRYLWRLHRREALAGRKSRTPRGDS